MREYPQCKTCNTPISDDNAYIMLGYLDSYCKSCRKVRSKKYDAEHPDTMKPYHKEYSRKWECSNRVERSEYFKHYHRNKKNNNKNQS